MAVAMTAPRQVLQGTTYLVTRRCTQRQFLLKPSKVTTAVFGYLLAVAARRYGVEVHAYCVLSNHYHLVVTDPQARLPAFQQFLDALVARAVNAHLGRWENLWATSSFSAVALASAQDVVDKAACTLANPVAAGLVRLGREWPGLWSSPGGIGAEVVFRRPKHFFSKKGCLPESVGLTLAVPPGFLTAQAFREALEQALAAREADAAQKSQGFLGAERVLAQRPFDRPKPGEPRRELSPRVAARDKWRRIELLGRLKDFVAAYRKALEQWCVGERTAVFPAGTYLMRVANGVACAGAG
jgi:REP element-mobilizing transposase RayT